jgi:hypothetical protein
VTNTTAALGYRIDSSILAENPYLKTAASAVG